MYSTPLNSQKLLQAVMPSSIQKTSCADSSFLYIQRSSCVGGWAHTVYYTQRAFSKWKIPPTHTLLWDLLSFFPQQTVHFPLLGRHWTEQWLPKLRAAELKALSIRCWTFLAWPISPSVEPNISHRGVQNSDFFFQAPSVDGWITKGGNVN